MFIRVDLPELDGLHQRHAFTRIDQASIRSSTESPCPGADTISTGSSGAPPAGRFRWVHSYRNASIGSSDARDRAGYSPEEKPRPPQTRSRRSRWPATKTPSSIPRTAQSQIRTGWARIPITSPTPLMTTAWIRNCPRISRRVARTALRIPIRDPLRHAREHDVHDSDAADQERDRRDRRQHDVEGPLRRLDRLRSSSGTITS